MSLVVEPLAPRHTDGMRALFESAGSACFCRFWHFEGNKNAWLERCAYRPEENFAELETATREGDPTARGLVAVDPEMAFAVLGWMKLAPSGVMGKMLGLPVYRSVAGVPISERTYTIGCFLVDPRARRRGIARALLTAAAPQAEAWGADAVLGFPRRSAEPLHDEEVWQGPERMFVELGYEVVHDVGPYPMYRKVLAGGRANATLRAFRA